MPVRPVVNIASYSFEQFIGFLFDKVVDPEVDLRDRWWRKITVVCDPNRTVGHYLRLFRSPAFLANQYSREQIEAGFSLMTSRQGFGVRSLIWNAGDIPFATRRQLVLSMARLFEHLFAGDPYGHTASLWWDCFCFDWECGNRQRGRGGEDETMQDVMLEALNEVLAIDSDICRGSALHGLSHLHHPETRDVVDRFLSANPPTDIGLGQFARTIGLHDPLYLRRSRF